MASITMSCGSEDWRKYPETLLEGSRWVDAAEYSRPLADDASRLFVQDNEIYLKVIEVGRGSKIAVNKSRIMLGVY